MENDVALVFLIAFAILGVYFVYLLILEALYAGRRVKGVTVLRGRDPEKLARQIYRIRHQLPENEVLVVHCTEDEGEKTVLPWRVSGVTEVEEEMLMQEIKKRL